MADEESITVAIQRFFNENRESINKLLNKEKQMNNQNINELQMTIQDAQETIEKLQAQVESANRQIKELKTKEQKKKWEPQGGDWLICNDGYPRLCQHLLDCKLFGTERPTKELAEKAAKQMRRFNRLLAYVHEFAPDYEPDWSCDSENKYYVYYNHEESKWDIWDEIDMQALETVYMPQQVAFDLVDKLNSGEVVLD